MQHLQWKWTWHGELLILNLCAPRVNHLHYQRDEYEDGQYDVGDSDRDYRSDSRSATQI